MAGKLTARERAHELLEDVPLPWLNEAYEARFKTALTRAIQAHEDAVREEAHEAAFVEAIGIIEMCCAFGASREDTWYRASRALDAARSLRSRGMP